MNYPKITIVTPSFNQGNFLEKTILSVIDQNYPNLDYIIIDGGSTDDSVRIIKKYEKYLSYWVSEKDNGQSHAINKGFAKATGDVLNWLCSDDFLEPGSLSHIADAFKNNENIHCYAGKLRQLSASGTIGFYGNMLMPLWEDTLRIRMLKQPSVYFSRYAVEKMGPVNQDLHYCMDADWLYRFLFLFKQDNIFEDDFLIANYYLHEGSKSVSQISGFLRESDSIIHSFARKWNLSAYIDLLESIELNRDYVFPEHILEKTNRRIIERIVFYHLLRKSTRIYSKGDFEFAKRFLALDHSTISIKEDEVKMMCFLNKYVKNSNWLLFKIRRAYLWRVEHKHLSFD